ncbi:MAG: alpha/beta hydrolase [Oscillospiraceae bacterium]|nr:alpha/beta hydrolase [Oscillospiraceae bacterium]
MKFHTFGSNTERAIVLIHGMLDPWQMWQTAIDAFSGDYYVIVPELDAHTEDEVSRFVAVEDEAAQIRQFLLENCGGSVYAICGLSMGGRIAASLAPLLPMPKLMIGIMKKSYGTIIRKSKQRDPKTLENAKRDFLPEALIPDFLKVADHMEEGSISNMLDSIFSGYDFRQLPCRILFLHGTKGNESVSKKAAVKMKAVNPQTEIRCFKGYAHAQLASFEAEKWVDEVKGFLEQE